MYVPELEQEMAVLGRDEAELLDAQEPGRWNIISISNEPLGAPVFPGARRLLRLAFDDVEDGWGEPDAVYASEEDIEKALSFARKSGNQPLLVHCTAGVSRSTALAWALVYDRLRGAPQAGRTAIEIVRRIRPMLMPNRHVLRLGIVLLTANASEAARLRKELAPLV